VSSARAPPDADDELAEEATVGTIVVGVDGSESSRHALDFALREAALRGARLRVVRAWSLWSAAVNGTAEPLPWPGGEGEAFDQVRRSADGQLAEWVRSAKAGTGAAAVDTEIETRPGDAVPVLREAARDADLVVLGVRERRDPTRLFLGSVSRELIRDAGCPVVLVPDTHAEPKEGR
jgi:nucleotide-binding universal stress UspA family protein